MAGPRPRATALLVDLDGTLRHWDHDVQAAAERRHGLAPGTILRTAMEWPRVQPAITGQITHAEWMAGRRGGAGRAGRRSGSGRSTAARSTPTCSAS